MRIRILGPMEVLRDDEWRRLSAPKWRMLLATLVINAGRPVPVERLVEEVWPDRAGPRSVNQLHGYVWRLRGALDDPQGRVLRTQSPGYELALGPDDSDVAVFERLARQGSDAMRDGASERARALLDDALALWRGPAYSDVTPTPTIRAEVDRLTERRVAAQEGRIDADLACGRHAELISELQTLTVAEPFREGLWAQLMLALYRSGRQADALAAYRQLYKRLGDDLGVEPGPGVRTLHQQILESSAALDLPESARVGASTGETRRPGEPPAAAGEVSRSTAPDGGATPDHQSAQSEPVDAEPRREAGPPTPRQLPADIADFTGRADYLRQLHGYAGDRVDRPGSVGITIISGTGGIGKTTLAVHWAHRVSELFPDGQLYTNLRGHASTSPVEPVDVLPQFLRALGVGTDQIPHHVDEMAALYRSQLADKRILVVLDNAASAGQVRPLLPGSPGSYVLVTSRDQLTGLVALDGAQLVELAQLDPDESMALLARITGSGRIDAEPAESERLARLCGHLPLALRIVAAQLAADPYRTVAAHARELDGADRLDALRIEDDIASTLSITFDLSYERLDPAAQTIFRLAGLIPGSEFGIAAVAALAGLESATVARLLARLASSHLLERRDHERYAFHDLIRLYAQRRTESQDGPDARSAARVRLLHWYLSTANEAVKLILPDIYRLPVDIDPAEPKPQFDTSTTAMAWLEMERPNLVPVVSLAADHMDGPPAWLFADALRGFYFFTRHTLEWLAVAQLGVAAASRAGNELGMAGAEVSLAQAYRCTTEYDAARDHGNRALELSRRVRWREGESIALNELAGVRFEQGGLVSGVDLLERAIAIDREIGNRELEAMHQMNVAMAYWHLGRLPLAAERLERIVEVGPRDGSPQRKALVLSNLAEVYWWLGCFERAQEVLEQALAIHADIRYPAGLLATHAILAPLNADLGRTGTALDHAQTVAELAKNIGSRRMEGHACTLLADVCLRSGQHEAAVRHGEQAVRILTEGASPLELIDSLLVVGASYLQTDDAASAYDSATSALRTAREQGARAYEGKATGLLAAVCLQQGDLAGADELAQAAATIHRETGHRPGEARILHLLGEIAERNGQVADAERHRTAANALASKTGLAELM